MGCTIGLVEDDDIIRANLSDFLNASGFSVCAHPDRLSALEAFREDPPDLAVLDVALGNEREGGFRLCSEIREFSETMPIIFLTSYDAEADKIAGLRKGADDYLSKEYSLEFLVVRIETLLARRKALSIDDDDELSGTMVGLLRIKAHRSEVYWNGERVPLSLTQYWMVHALASSPAIAKSPDELMKAARIRVAPNTIAAHIRSIRQRFESIDPTFDSIRTERGLGYRWVI